MEKQPVEVLDEAINAVLELKDPGLEPAVAVLKRLRHVHEARCVFTPGSVFDLEVDGIYTGTLEALQEFDLGEIINPVDPRPGGKVKVPDELIERGLVRRVPEEAHCGLRMVIKIETHGHSEVAS